jgi:myo-inositol-1(or 4)-monophosphatase
MLPDSLQKLSNLVRDIADRELPPRFNCKRGERKTDGSLVTEADLVVQAALNQALRTQWPDIAVLGEEMTETEQHKALAGAESGSGVWCIDPLDGTSNFAVGVPYYAVSVALVKNREVQMGVVYDPSRKECFAAARNQGAWLNGAPLKQSHLSTPLAQAVAMIDLKRLPAELAARLAALPPYKSQRSFGAVALDWCWLAAGRCHIYLHGRQKLWDYAAGSLILRETGGQAMTLDGEPVFTPTLEPRSAAAALDRSMFSEWKQWLAAT